MAEVKELRKPRARYLHSYGPYSSTHTNPLALWAEKWYYRFISNLVLIPLFVLTVVLFPILILIGLPIDLYRRKKLGGIVCCRIVTFFLFYMISAILGQLLFFLLYLVSWITWPSRQTWLKWNYVLEHIWGVYIFYKPCMRALGLKLEVELPKEGLSKGPKILLMRHSSFGDTLIPQALLSKDFQMRYIVKKELIYDPALNAGGSRTPNFFLYREVGQGGIDVEMEAIRNLVRDFTPDLPAVTTIWPEGTRFSPKKREHVLASLQKKDLKTYAIAKELHHTLLPRPGGAIALLEENPCADVLFCSHVGLEGAVSFKEILSGKICNSSVKVKFVQVKYKDIPKTREEQTAWLYMHWQQIDKWVGENLKYTSPKANKHD